MKKSEPKESKTIAVPEKKQKAPKQEKMIPAKKLPKIFKKNYSKKQLEKLFRHIYVSSHRELVEKLFVPNQKKEGKFYIPREQKFPKSQFVKLKKIGKDVASQKFSIKLVPLAATVAAAAAVVILVCTFKNIVARKVLTNVMQGVFGAKTDIGYINVEFFDSSIYITDLAQGYKDDPMKNLFQFDKVAVDFNLTQLLRGKFDLENIAVEGINVMTPRKTSAALPEKEKSSEKNSFQLELENKMQVAQDSAKDELTNLFAQYNPESILNSLQNQLASPAVAKEVYTIGESLVNKWSAKPAEISESVTAFSAKVTKLANTNFSGNADAAQIKAAIENITEVLAEGNKLALETKSIVDDIQKDSLQIKNASEKVSAAIKEDSSFVNSELDKIKSFKADDGLRLLSAPIDSILYKIIGKYYPYVKQGISLAMKAKESSSGNAETKVKETKKSSSHERLAGINVYYKKDRVPKFLIEKMSVSGVNFSALATNISSDMDKRGEPAVADVSFDIGSQTHKGNITVDARSATDNPLVAVQYSGNNYPIAFQAPQFSLDSSSVISGQAKAFDDGRFVLSADLKMKNLKFETEKFEPEFAYNLYSKALSYFKEIQVGVSFDFKNEDSFNMNVSTDADRQFLTVLQNLVNDELESLKTYARTQITDLLNEKTNGATSKINEFISIENGINAENLKVKNLNSTLEAKKKEFQSKLESEAKKAASNAIGNALNNLKFGF